MAKAAKLEFKKRRLRGLTGNELKLIACLCMVCDHIGYVLIENGVLYGRNPDYWALAIATPEGQHWLLAAKVLRIIGSLAFPIFAYMLVEGFLHTKNLRNYLRNLLLCALVSEVPFDLACYHTWFYPFYQNVCFTLFLGVVTMWLMKKAMRISFVLSLLAAALMAGAAWLIRCDYGAVGIGLIALLWLMRKDHTAQMWLGAVLSGLQSVAYYCAAALAFVPLHFYNGRRGTAPMKYFFYLFYPLHLLAFYLLVYLTNR